MDSEILAKQSNTPPMYKFKLIELFDGAYSNNVITLQTEPIGWNSGVIEISRNIKVGGVFTSFTVDSLTFIKEGAKFVRDIFNRREING